MDATKMESCIHCGSTWNVYQGQCEDCAVALWPAREEA